MSGFILHLGATVTCSHGGQATPAIGAPRVLVGGQPVVVMGTPYLIGGCTLPPPPSGNGPCLTGQFTTSATRVLAGGAPVLVSSGASACNPTGSPLLSHAVQARVTAT